YRAYGALLESGWAPKRARDYIDAELAKRTHPGENSARVSQTQLRLGVHILVRHPVGAFKDWAAGEARLLLGPGKSETATLLTGKEGLGPAGRRGRVGRDALVRIAPGPSGGPGGVALPRGRAA